MVHLKTSGLTVDFGSGSSPIRALDSIDLALEGGSVVAVHGENGSGKSTLLWALSGLLLPSAGLLTFSSPTRPAVGYPGDSLQSSPMTIGFLAHQSFLYEDLTVMENLVLAARLQNLDSPWDRALDFLNRVGLGDHASKRISALSRGQTQRAAFARAALPGPDVLLLDEPFSNLDRPGIAAISEVIGSMRSPDRVIVLATLDPVADDVSRLSTRRVELRCGRVVS